MRQSTLHSSSSLLEVHRTTCIHTIACLITALSMLSACATGGAPRRDSGVEAEEAVRSTELKLAKAMADRDFDAFVSHLSSDAVFFDDRKIQRGAAEVSAAWKPLINGSKAPFSWAPDHVEVLASGDLELKTRFARLRTLSPFGGLIERFDSFNCLANRRQITQTHSQSIQSCFKFLLVSSPQVAPERVQPRSPCPVL
jgi:ketosteroid isomerase-like protein